MTVPVSCYVCDRPASFRDNYGVPLCAKCADKLGAETVKEAVKATVSEAVVVDKAPPVGDLVVRIDHALHISAWKRGACLVCTSMDQTSRGYYAHIRCWNALSDADRKYVELHSREW